jgi:hypothetical protein
MGAETVRGGPKIDLNGMQGTGTNTTVLRRALDGKTQFCWRTRPEAATQLLRRYPPILPPISLTAIPSTLVPCCPACPLLPLLQYQRDQIANGQDEAWPADRTSVARVPSYFPLSVRKPRTTSLIISSTTTPGTRSRSTTAKPASSSASGESPSPQQTIPFLSSIYFASSTDIAGLDRQNCLANDPSRSVR